MKQNLLLYLLYIFHHSSGTQRLYVIDECWKHHPTGVFFKKMSHFRRPYDKAIVRLREAGVFDHILSGYSLIAPSKINIDAGLIVLKIHHYEGLFYLLVILLGMDVIIFMIEVLWFLIFKSPL